MRQATSKRARIERARVRARALAAAACAATVVAVALTGSGSAVGEAAAAHSRPNVVVIETDDQTQESMKVMSAVNARIAANGVTFANSFVNFSLCCPSRATFLTGQYAHNHGVVGNAPPKGGFAVFERRHAHDNLAVWLEHAGYHTGLIGKYLNLYGRHDPTLVPPGWSEWHAALDGGAPGVEGNSQAVYDYTLNENGTLVDYGSDPQDFKQDVLTQKAVDFIDLEAPKPAPFFLWLTYTAPHYGGPNPSPQPPSDCQSAPKPAPRHADAFASAPLPQPPSFNEADVSDKPRYVRREPKLDPSQIAELTRTYRCELESLLSVDEGVGRVLDALKQEGELRNTYVVYTSDNGFMHGEHRIPGSKTFPYEESIRVPLLIRGPGIPQGATARDLVINADLAPTVARIAGAKPRLTMDGRSLLGAARHPGRRTGRDLLVEATRFHEIPAYDAIRTRRYMFISYHDGERELYDLKRDPFELRNRASDPAYGVTRRRLADGLRKLKRCAGRTCRASPTG
jgi:N-acetylglucosamine-6-sulfatase